MLDWLNTSFLFKGTVNWALEKKYRCSRHIPLVDAYHITPLTNKYGLQLPQHNVQFDTITPRSNTCINQVFDQTPQRPNHAEMQRLFQLFLKDLAAGPAAHRYYSAENPKRVCYQHHYETAGLIDSSDCTKIQADIATKHNLNRKIQPISFTYHPSPALHV